MRVLFLIISFLFSNLLYADNFTIMQENNLSSCNNIEIYSHLKGNSAVSEVTVHGKKYIQVIMAFNESNGNIFLPIKLSYNILLLVFNDDHNNTINWSKSLVYPINIGDDISHVLNFENAGEISYCESNRILDSVKTDIIELEGKPYSLSFSKLVQRTQFKNGIFEIRENSQQRYYNEADYIDSPITYEKLYSFLNNEKLYYNDSMILSKISHIKYTDNSHIVKNNINLQYMYACGYDQENKQVYCFNITLYQPDYDYIESLGYHQINFYLLNIKVINDKIKIESVNFTPLSTKLTQDNLLELTDDIGHKYTLNSILILGIDRIRIKHLYHSEIDEYIDIPYNELAQKLQFRTPVVKSINGDIFTMDNVNSPNELRAILNKKNYVLPQQLYSTTPYQVDKGWDYLRLIFNEHQYFYNPRIFNDGIKLSILEDKDRKLIVKDNHVDKQYYMVAYILTEFNFPNIIIIKVKIIHDYESSFDSLNFSLVTYQEYQKGIHLIPHETQLSIDKMDNNTIEFTDDKSQKYKIDIRSVELMYLIPPTQGVKYYEPFLTKSVDELIKYFAHKLHKIKK